MLQDFDGDGEQDAAVFYTTALTSNVCVAFLRKNSGGAWQVSQTVEGLADSVDNVRLAQLQAGGTSQLVVGYAASQDDHYLAVYSYENGEVSAILEQAYEQYLVEDITGGGSEDLILMSTLEDSGVQIELLTVDKDGSFQQVAVMALSGDKFSGCASVAAGLGADGSTIWCWTAGRASRAIIWPRCCCGSTMRASRWCRPLKSPARSCTMPRCAMSVPSLVSRFGRRRHRGDTDPARRSGSAEHEPEPTDGFYRLDGLHASAPEKSFGLLDEETGCYIALPIEWEGNLMLTDSTDEEDAVELRTVDENKLVLTLRLASSSENAVGWTRLGVVASRQMQAKLGPDVTIEDPDYRLSRSLYRLN